MQTKTDYLAMISGKIGLRISKEKISHERRRTAEAQRNQHHPKYGGKNSREQNPLAQH